MRASMFLFAMSVFLGGCANDDWEVRDELELDPVAWCPCTPEGSASVETQRQTPTTAAEEDAEADGGGDLEQQRDGRSREGARGRRSKKHRRPSKGSIARKSSSRKSAPSKPENEDCIDLNQAPIERLVTLPGIGPGRARTIVARRAQRPFSRRKEITRIRGIGGKTYRKLASRLCPLSGDQ